MQQLAMSFAVFHNVANVARADPETFGGNYRILGGNGGIRDCQSQIAHTGIPGLTAGRQEGIVPLFAVGTEDQHHFCSGNKGLIVTGFYKHVLNSLIGDINDGIQLLISCSGGLGGRPQDQILFFGSDFPVCKDADGFTVEQRLNGGIHGFSSLSFFFAL